jgi:hypothetical protein
MYDAYEVFEKSAKELLPCLFAEEHKLEAKFVHKPIEIVVRSNKAINYGKYLTIDLGRMSVGKGRLLSAFFTALLMHKPVSFFFERTFHTSQFEKVYVRFENKKKFFWTTVNTTEVLRFYLTKIRCSNTSETATRFDSTYQTQKAVEKYLKPFIKTHSKLILVEKVSV